MSVRIGAGFRLGRHIYIGASVPLGHHARRLAAHQGHGDWFDTLVGLGACNLTVESLGGANRPIYLARVKMTVATPPADACGSVNFNSSPLITKERFCSVSFQFGNVELST
jgi:hypothetical protein